MNIRNYIILGLFFATSIFVTHLAFADNNGVWHLPADIRPGTFGSDELDGNYYFVDNVSVPVLKIETPGSEQPIQFINSSGVLAGIQMYNGNFHIGDYYSATPNDIDLIFYTADSPRMTIKAQGNIGIGTDLPESKLTLSQSDSGWDDGLVIKNTNNNSWTILADGGSSDGFLTFSPLDSATVQGDYSKSLIIRENGNVGIGVSNYNPEEKLHVEGDIKANGIVANDPNGNFVITLG
jgi:hypothetical protein